MRVLFLGAVDVCMEVSTNKKSLSNDGPILISTGVHLISHSIGAKSVSYLVPCWEWEGSGTLLTLAMVLQADWTVMA